jgi:hypothetical protein
MSGYQIIFSGLILFFIGVCLHVAVWRLFRPIRDLLSLLAVFLAIPFSSFLVLAYLDHAGTVGAASFVSGVRSVDQAAVFLLYFALVAAYIISYPAIQARCPTLQMVLRIDGSMPGGLGFEDLAASFDRRDILEDRIEDLARSGLIRESGKGYAITRRGLVLLKPFLILRSLLGLPAGSG